MRVRRSTLQPPARPPPLPPAPPRRWRTLGIQRRLAGLVLGDLVHGVLLALLALAEGLLGLRDVHLQHRPAPRLTCCPGRGPKAHRWGCPARRLAPQAGARCLRARLMRSCSQAAPSSPSPWWLVLRSSQPAAEEAGVGQRPGNEGPLPIPGRRHAVLLECGRTRPYGSN